MVQSPPDLCQFPVAWMHSVEAPDPLEDPCPGLNGGVGVEKSVEMGQKERTC